MNVLLRGSTQQILRLASGLVLFAFATAHFLNHALGLIDIDAMLAAQSWRTEFTRSLLGGMILGVALLTHVSLALWKLAGRATWRMPLWEALQILLGLSIPFLLFPHIVNTRVAQQFFGVHDTYWYELPRLWPGSGLDQSVLMLLVWTHGCLGLHFWLRLSPAYPRVAPYLLAFAVLLPALSLSGFMVAGRAANVAIADPAFFATLKAQTNWPDAASGETLATLRSYARWGFGLLIALVILFPVLRRLVLRIGAFVPVHYTTARTVSARPGPTLLEISRMNNIPHASICGGRGRCSTCRVKILEGAENLAPPSAAEWRTLKSIGATPDMRLACQIRPATELTVTPLIRPLSVHGGRVPASIVEAAGVEREIVVLFLDIRGFTRLSERRLPYDVVFVLNRFFADVGAAIEAHGGHIDKYLGDGLLAIFGRNIEPSTACRDALAAAHAIDLALDTVNRDLHAVVNAPITIGMGLHVGPLVLGLIGHGPNAGLTVIGETVNIASRLESLTRDHDCQLILSSSVAHLAGLPTHDLPEQVVEVRGSDRSVAVLLLDRARNLPSLSSKVASNAA